MPHSPPEEKKKEKRKKERKMKISKIFGEKKSLQVKNK